MTAMNRYELIDALEELIAEGKAEIARRQAEREADPIKMDNYMRAQRQDEKRAAVVTKGGAESLIFKTTGRSAPAVEAFTADQKAVLMHLVAELRAEFERDLRHVRAAVNTELYTGIEDRKKLDDLARRVEGLVTKDHGVIDLPREFWQRRRDGAA